MVDHLPFTDNCFIILGQRWPTEWFVGQLRVNAGKHGLGCKLECGCRCFIALIVIPLALIDATVVLNMQAIEPWEKPSDCIFPILISFTVFCGLPVDAINPQIDIALRGD